MRLAFVNTLYAPYRIGGAELSLQILAETLAQQGHDVTVYSLSEGLPERGLLNGVKTEQIQLNLKWPFSGESRTPFDKAVWRLFDLSNREMVHRLNEAVRQNPPPDLFITNNLFGFSPAIIPALAALGPKVIHIARDYYLTCLRSTMFKGDRDCSEQCMPCALSSRLKRKPLSHLSGFIGISQYIADVHLKAGMLEDNLQKTVIHNPIERLPASPTPRAADERLRFGFIGRLAPSKGIELLLRSFKGVSKDFELLVAGTGTPSYEEHLRSEHASPNIRFLGFVKPESFFSQIDLLVVPALWNEPFGRIVVEAMAHGIPSIATTMGGIPEIITHGSDGFLFNPRRDELGQILNEVSGDRSRIAAWSRNAIKTAQQYESAVIARQHISFYSDVLADAKLSAT